MGNTAKRGPVQSPSLMREQRLKHFKLQGDLGQDIVSPDDGPTRNLTKASIALTLGVDRAFMARPELRLFYTYAHWNQAAQQAAAPGDTLSSTGTFGDSRDGSTAIAIGVVVIRTFPAQGKCL